MKENIFLLHSLNADTLEYWGKDVEEFAAAEGIDYHAPNFPIREKSTYQSFDEILSKFLENGSLNASTIVVAHSIGVAYFSRFMREHCFVPKYFVAVAPGAVYKIPETRNDYIVTVKEQAYLKKSDLEFAKKLDNVILVHSDEGENKNASFVRFAEDFNAKAVSLKGYNHFDGRHGVRHAPEIIELLKELLKK